jgi:hypothetical protein
VLSLPDGTATVSWRTNEKSSSRVLFGTRAKRLTGVGFDDTPVTRHSIVLTGLDPDRTYFYRVVSRDPAGNRAATAKKRPLRFVTTAPGVAEHTASKFRAGDGTNTSVRNATFGAITVAKGHRSASYRSLVLDAQQFVTWDRATWQASVPAGTALRVWVRTGSRLTPDKSWSGWQRVTASGGLITTAPSRYLQYRLELTRRGDKAATLTSIGFTHNQPPLPPEKGLG